MSGDYFGFIEWLKQHHKKVFVDLKFFDVPATVGRAIKALSSKGVDLATIHGNDAIMEAAVQEKGDLKVLAVTALTSLDRGDLDDLGSYAMYVTWSYPAQNVPCKSAATALFHQDLKHPCSGNNSIINYWL